MMDAAIVTTYTHAVSGREKEALDAFTQAMAFWASAAHDGTCGEALNVMAPSGHSLIIVPGEYEKLAALVRTEEFRDMFDRATFAAEDLGYEVCAYGKGVQDAMARWARIGQELALI